MPVYFEGKRKKVRYGRDLVEVRFGKKTQKEAFAVFSADDGSLSFYKRFGVPKVGEQFEGKTVTEVYTGIETDRYSDYLSVPWNSRLGSWTNVVKVIDVIKPVSTASWFSGYSKTTPIDLSGLDTSSVTNMSNMFSQCINLKTINVSNFDTSKVTNMSNMFSQCINLKTINVSNFDTSKVTNMSNMFNECKFITSIDLSSWNTTNVKDMHSMFLGCSGLTTIDLSSWKTTYVTDMGSMFFGCSSLQSLDLSNFNTYKLTYTRSMFDNCVNLFKVKLGLNFAWKGTGGYLPAPSASNIPNADGKWYALSDGKGYASENIPNNKADTYYAYPPTETWNTIMRTGVPAMGTSSDIFVSPSKTTKYRATLDTTSSAQGRGMSVYIYNANSGSMISNVQLSITGARTQYFELNQGNYKINAFFDCHNGYPSTLILEEKIGFEFAPIN